MRNVCAGFEEGKVSSWALCSHLITTHTQLRTDMKLGPIRFSVETVFKATTAAINNDFYHRFIFDLVFHCAPGFTVVDNNAPITPTVTDN